MAEPTPILIDRTKIRAMLDLNCRMMDIDPSNERDARLLRIKHGMEAAKLVASVACSDKLGATPAVLFVAYASEPVVRSKTEEKNAPNTDVAKVKTLETEIERRVDAIKTDFQLVLRNSTNKVAPQPANTQGVRTIFGMSFGGQPNDVKSPKIKQAPSLEDTIRGLANLQPSDVAYHIPIRVENMTARTAQR